MEQDASRTVGPAHGNVFRAPFGLGLQQWYETFRARIVADVLDALAVVARRQVAMGLASVDSPTAICPVRGQDPPH